MILLVLTFTSCEKLDLRSYYFQMSNFQTNKIYKYVDRNDQTNVQQIRMRYELDNNDTIFYSETLDELSRPKEVFIEKIDGINSKIVDYFLVEYDSLGLARKGFSDVKKREVFSFDESNYPLLWKVKANNKGRPEIIEKKRTFLFKDTVLAILDNDTKCIIFKDEYLIKDPESISFYTFYQNTYYALRLGMVRFERFFSNGFVYDYWLEEIK